MREAEISKLSKVNFEARALEKKIHDINDNLRYLEKAEIQFKNLPKNIFGHYKNKNRAETLESSIQDYNNNLTYDGYKSGNNTIKLDQKKIDDLQKNSKQLKWNIESLDQDTDTIKIGVEALKNKELREFQINFKEEFPQDKYLRYYDMQKIKAVYALAGVHVDIAAIRHAYKDSSERIDTIDKELEGIKKSGIRLDNIKQAFETIDKYKDIIDKWDT